MKSLREVRNIFEEMCNKFLCNYWVFVINFIETCNDLKKNNKKIEYFF